MPVETFRKLPVTVDTILWDGTEETYQEIQDWTGHSPTSLRFRHRPVYSEDDTSAEVWNTEEETWIPCAVGHRVVKGRLGEFYPVSPAAVAETYEAPGSPTRVDLTFHAVAEVNRARCERWHPGFPNDGWTGADWSNAMAGEAGETCNVVKKLRRDDFGKVQAAADSRPGLIAKLATEIGDTFMYLDLLAQFYGLDLAQCVTDTFNRVSEREGFPERISA